MVSTNVIEQAGGLPLPIVTISDPHSQDDVEPITPVLEELGALLKEANLWNKKQEYLLWHRQMIEEVTRQTEVHTECIQGQAQRLWDTLKMDWSTAEQEVNCHICFCKLWAAVALFGSMWTHLLPRLYIEETPQFTCMSCGVVLSQRPVRVQMIENVVKLVPTMDDEEGTQCESTAQNNGYIGEESWKNFFP
ncbi:hypothetical protein F5146DRAFT_999284 [Armillaria mellea]|nr:hypothetical protein F5146DRAFT_999284 [Armillaria mellea]